MIISKILISEISINFLIPPRERIRTMLNVTGDCFVMICMQSMLSKWLQRPRDPAEGETMEVGN